MRQIARALMLFWYAATAVLVIHYVFTDPQFDYRMLVIGSTVPVIGDITGGWLSALNSITVAVVALIGVMAITVGRRPRRRFLLGLPIGFLLHSVFGASWATNNVIWWPFGGLDLGTSDAAISSRGVTPLVLEIVGVGLTVWIMKRNHLQSWEQLRSWTRDGRLTFQ